MGYFPFFIDITAKKCVVVGGGIVAKRKVEKLLPYEPEITVVAPEICGFLRLCEGITLVEREFEPADLDGAFMVIGATDNETVNAEIFRLCTEKNILANVVDDKEKCGFIFPALVKKGDISIGVSSSGSSPVFSKYIKEKIDEILSESELEKGRILSDCREKVRRELPTESQRKAAFEEILQLSENGSQIDIDRVIDEVKHR